MINLIRILLTSISWFVITGVNAQDSASFSKSDQTSYWDASINYTSNNVYLGRKDSLQLPYITPSISYYHKSGLYLRGSLSYLASAQVKQVDLVSIEGGYYYSSGNFQGQVSASKLFFNSKSTNVRAEVKADLDAYGALDLGFIKPSLEGVINFSAKNDYILAFGLEHTFKALNQQIDFTPSVFVNSATQNAYGSYYSKRKYAARKKIKRGAGQLYYDLTADVTDAAKFKLLDYEFSIPVNYALNKFTFNFTPSLAIPTNPANIIYTVKPSVGAQYTSTYTENLQTPFFWSIGLTYTID